MQIQNIIPAHLVVAMSAWLSRIIAAVSQLLIIRLILENLGEEAYSIFALLVGLTAWFTLAEFGIGYSVQNYISEERSKGRDPRPYIYIGFSASLVALIILGIVVVIVSPFVGPVYLASGLSLSDAEKILLFSISAFSLGGMALGSVAYKVWYAEQRGYYANFAIALASVAGLFGAYLVLGSSISNRLLYATAAFLAPTAILPLFVILIRGIGLIGKVQFDIESARKVFHRGVRFWVFAAMSVAVLNIDYLVLSQIAESEEIAKYAITQKVFGFMLAIYGAVLMALWPVFAECWGIGEYGKIKNMLRRYLTIGLLAMLFFCLIFVLYRNSVAKIISGGAVEIPVSLILLIGAYYMLRVWTDTFAVVLQSASDMSVFWRWVPLQMIVSISLQILLAQVYGIYGVVLGLILSFVLTVAWVLPRAVKLRFLGCEHG